MKGRVWDDTVCTLGEGPLWHPTRSELFWFDIVGCRLLTRQGGATRSIGFDEHASAAGWIDETTLIVATETRLLRLDVETERTEDICALEADNPVTRSNDGRADPWGGFWIGTMGRQAEPEAGSIYRLFRGELRRLHERITITNSICFAPDGSCAYFTDTPTRVVMRQALDPATGWPAADPVPWLDLNVGRWRPDGAVTDAAGNFWSAQWGGWRVACYSPDGTFIEAVAFDAASTSCPAFGGDDFTTLFCTSAAGQLAKGTDAASASHGRVFAAENAGHGRAEPQVAL